MKPVSTPPYGDGAAGSVIFMAINSLWKKDKRPFTFEPYSNGYDYSGNDPRHSPLWVRPESLAKTYWKTLILAIYRIYF